ncbi:hypothetical protein CASFOL_005913 [Castilleja foliolosa]|uniref:Peroxisomal membrane protein PEX16 n=1 Tax=Castilleja foliolosa TaxID=1961234 RepID=A0ABD3E8S8_9LAMI
MEAYKRWVQRNKDYVHSLESLANGLTWLLPERFSESEIGPEAGFVELCVTSILGIITTINEHILETTPTHTRTGHLESSSSFPFALCITLLKDLETLVEVIAQQIYGEDKKWNLMAITESIKVLFRLAILRKSGYKMLLHGGEITNEGNESNGLDPHRNGLLLDPGPHGAMKNYHERNLEERALSALSRFGDNARAVSEPTWLRRVQHQQTIMEPPTLVSEKPTSLSTFLSEKGIYGSLFLTVDLIGHGIVSSVTILRRNSNDFHLSNLEKNELKRRKLLWALYLMRDPFFSMYTRRRLGSAEKLLQPIPIIGLLAEKLVELLEGAQTRYTYMSGS